MIGRTLVYPTYDSSDQIAPVTGAASGMGTGAVPVDRGFLTH